MRLDAATYAKLAEDIRAEFGDDDQLVSDMLEGETDFHDVIGRLLAALTDAEGMAEACKDMASAYLDRARRHEDRQAAVKRQLHWLLEVTGQRKVAHAYATVSLRAVPPKAVFDGDPASLDEAFRKVTIKADLTALKKALEAGAVVPGASLTNGGETLAVRRK